MVAPARRSEVRAIPRVHGSDRKTPIDGVPAEPELTEPERRSAAGSAPGVASNRPPPIEPSERTVGEAETPQAASISAADAEKKPGSQRRRLWARVAARVPFTRGVGKAVAVAGGIAAMLGRDLPAANFRSE